MPTTTHPVLQDLFLPHCMPARLTGDAATLCLRPRSPSVRI